MGRRYYCDYCDKTFIDDLDARKKHLQSSHHIKLRNLHYEYARDPETILREELLKTPCRRFEQYGLCQFAGNCKYTHYSPEELCELRQEVENIQTRRRQRQIEASFVKSPESWVEKYKSENCQDEADVVETFWNYPEQLEHRQDLPPSLKKFKPEHFTEDTFEEWGK